MRRPVLLLATLLTLGGCTTAATPGPATPSARPQLDLVAFDSCDSLLTELRAATQRTVTSYGLTAPMPESWSGVGRAASTPPHSSTNVHEPGVDEPDVVKTDGRRIVTIDRGTLRVIDPATRSVTGSVALGSPGAAQLLLSGDHALVLTAERTMAGRLRGGLLPPNGNVDLTFVDLTGAPKVLSHYRSVGRVVDARQTGNVARVVLSSIPRINFPTTAARDDVLLRENRAAIGTAPIDAWLPSWQVTGGGSAATGRLGCDDVRRPKSFSGASLLTLLTFDLNAPALDSGNPLGVVADGEMVYGTPSTLYIANDRTAEPGTEIFQFATPPTGGKPVLVGSGTVPGTLLDQYAMSEWDGRLRVATTAKNESAVRVLENHGGDLVPVGEVGGLGADEQIYAVRFLGSRAYVVTFRQTDPLYSLDLSDPTAPRVTGQLKITGYSAHLQQVGEDRLVGVGQEASPDGVRQGMSVSLFDVGDATPRRLDQHVTARAVSDAEFDPRALLWWPATSLLVLPVKGSREGATGFRVEGDKLREVGHLDGYVRRSLVIGDNLWTLGDGGLTVASLSTLDTLATVRFQK
ncbi:hypothetical protein GCM10010172_53050 [Paractinoplanes ferrugineus]|uniref:Beta propeller domain-containing protein n=1 Tax=Paractinoplanes ferrugineus TaxID=113564 RepID=A0A919IZB6_9ACTN|nr:beta-propeller domain-containing protein [Actinoplanes ferrugineus]GIE11876.1 hypothetical protein Afe05nite_37160 [Actinoplanes ferrugineus]